MHDYDCLSGVCRVPDNPNWEREQWEHDFWEWRYRRQIELKLNPDGTPKFESEYWGMNKEEREEYERKKEAERQRELAIQKEIDEWKPPTPQDIIDVSAFLFIRKIPFDRQHYADKFPWKYVCVEPGSNLRKKYEYREDRNWCWLRIPMNLYMQMHGIEFDGLTYKVGGKSYTLPDVIAKISTQVEDIV